jgi:DNA-binding NtrC family response regulator
MSTLTITESKGMILVVDDEPTMCELMKAYLENEGFDVITASNGIDGLNRFEEHKGEVRMVVTDLDMPAMNGSDMIRQMYRIAPTVKVIVASGQSLLYVMANEPREGTSCLQKPYTARELTDAVRLLL